MKGDNDLGYIAKADAIRAVIDMLHPYLELEDAAFRVFDAIPTVEPEPKRGRWEVVDAEEPRRYGCSECKRLSWLCTPFCPQCGAKMEEEK